MLAKKRGSGGSPPENFYIFEAAGLHLILAFSKANRPFPF
jgi:hypothetical protein